MFFKQLLLHLKYLSWDKLRWYLVKFRIIESIKIITIHRKSVRYRFHSKVRSRSRLLHFLFLFRLIVPRHDIISHNIFLRMKRREQEKKVDRQSSFLLISHCLPAHTISVVLRPDGLGQLQLMIPDDLTSRSPSRNNHRLVPFTYVWFWDRSTNLRLLEVPERPGIVYVGF